MASEILNCLKVIRPVLALSLSLQIIVAGACPAMAEDEARAIKLNNEGVKALNDSNFPLAIEKLEEAVKVAPGYALSRENLGIAYNNFGLKLRGTPKEALKLFHKACDLQPSNMTTWQNINGIIQILGKNPKNFQDRIGLAEEARASGDIAGAIIEYKAAVQIKDDAAIRLKMAQLLKARGEIDKAIDEYRVASKLSDSAEIELALGQAYGANKEIANALSAYERALALKPGDGDVIEALKAGWSEAVKDNPSAPENHLGLALTFERAHDFSAAEAEFKTADKLSKGKNQAAQDLLAALPALKAQSSSDSKSLYANWPEAKIHPNPDLDKCIADATEKILVHLGVISYKATRPARIRFSVMPSGAINSAVTLVRNSTGVTAFDDEIVRAIKQSAPFLGGKAERLLEASVSVGDNTLTIRDCSKDRDPDFSHYMADLQRKIKRNWFPPKETETKRVTVIFKVHAGGEVTDVRIGHSSEIPLADQAAIAAVQKASPLDSLPEGSPDDVDIQFTFDYNVFNHTDQTHIQAEAAKIASQMREKRQKEEEEARKLAEQMVAKDRQSQPNKVSSSQASASADYQLAKEGLKALGERDFSLAIQLLASALAADPGNSSTKRSLCIAYNEYGQAQLAANPEMAMDNFRKAKKLWPDNPMVPESIEHARTMFGQPKSAATPLISGVEKTSTASDSHASTASNTHASTSTADADKVAAVSSGAGTFSSQEHAASGGSAPDLDEKPCPLPVPGTGSDSSIFKATVKYNQGVKEELADHKDLAITFYKNASDLDPDFFQPHYRLAVLFRERQDKTSALAQVTECLKIKPDDAYAKKLLSLLK